MSGRDAMQDATEHNRVPQARKAIHSKSTQGLTPEMPNGANHLRRGQRRNEQRASHEQSAATREQKWPESLASSTPATARKTPTGRIRRVLSAKSIA
jgi:hypothetical protein